MSNKIDLKDIVDIAIKAGKEVLEVYNEEFEIEYKDDKSPLTKADKLSHKIITEGLKKCNLPILSEERKNIPYEKRKDWNILMSDPLGGTKEFIEKNGKFTINVTLIYKDAKIFGVVYAPTIDISFML